MWVATQIFGFPIRHRLSVKQKYCRNICQMGRAVGLVSATGTAGLQPRNG